MKPTLYEMLESCVAVMGWQDLKDAAEGVNMTVEEFKAALKPPRALACERCGHPDVCVCEDDRTYPENVIEDGVAV